MNAAVQKISPFGSIIKKFRLDAVLFYAYCATPFLGFPLFLDESNEKSIVVALVVWFGVPVAWIICVGIVGIAFEKQYGMVWNYETHEMDNTQPRKRKLVLLFAPITLWYYTIKSVITWLISKIKAASR